MENLRITIVLNLKSEVNRQRFEVVLIFIQVESTKRFDFITPKQ